MRGKESEYTNSFKRTLIDMGGYLYKIPDDPKPGGFKIARPFDCFGVYYGLPLAIEFKWDTEPKAINTKRLSPNQHDGLSRFSASGGLALVGLFVRVKRGDVRLILWRYGDFMARGRVLKGQIENEPFAGFSNKENRFDHESVEKIILDLQNGF